MSRARRNQDQVIKADGPGGPKEYVLTPMKMHPLLKTLITSLIGFLTVVNVLWLSGYWNVSGDSMDGALRGIALLAGPLAIILLNISDRQ